MQQASITQSATGVFESAFPAIASRHNVALNQLHRYFTDGQGVAILAGQGKFEVNHVISRFAGDLGDDVTVVRLTKPYTDITEGLQAINRGLGFEPKSLSAGDLQSILSMYLEFQKKHQRRTVIAVEQIERQANWLLDSVRRLVEQEFKEHNGLMVVLAGNPTEFTELLCREPLATVRKRAGSRINLEPFSSSETLEFVRQRVEASGAGDISQLFDFGAISELHELTQGIPDEVAKLCCRCLQIANQAGGGPIDDEVVARAAKELESDIVFAPTARLLDETINENLHEISVIRQHLVVRLNDKWLKDVALDKGSVVIGRGKQSDLVLPSKYVSRAHAIVVKTDDGLLLRDLGSKNGTFVGAYRIDEYELEAGDVVRVGDFLIEYAAR